MPRPMRNPNSRVSKRVERPDSSSGGESSGWDKLGKDVPFAGEKKKKESVPLTERQESLRLKELVDGYNSAEEGDAKDYAALQLVFFMRDNANEKSDREALAKRIDGLIHKHHLADVIFNNMDRVDFSSYDPSKPLLGLRLKDEDTSSSSRFGGGTLLGSDASLDPKPKPKESDSKELGQGSNSERIESETTITEQQYKRMEQLLARVEGSEESKAISEILASVGLKHSTARLTPEEQAFVDQHMSAYRVKKKQEEERKRRDEEFSRAADQAVARMRRGSGSDYGELRRGVDDMLSVEEAARREMELDRKRTEAMVKDMRDELASLRRGDTGAGVGRGSDSTKDERKSGKGKGLFGGLFGGRKK